ncbi:hemicentin-1-like [Lates japonicus]
MVDPAQHCGPCSTVLPWAIAGVSLIVNIIYTVCVVFLWDANKKLKANQEESRYVALQKTDSSPVYDVIGEPLN